MIGMLTGTTTHVRGHDSSGTPLSMDEMAGVVTHEVSHWLVKEYGELPLTDVNASSFDRYADEFRGYWIQYKSMAGSKPGGDRAKAIREHLVGTAGTRVGYSNFHSAYFAAGPGPNLFKQQVDALAGPPGYNLTNSKMPAGAVATVDGPRVGRARRDRHRRHRPVHRWPGGGRAGGGGALDPHPEPRSQGQRRR